MKIKIIASMLVLILLSILFDLGTKQLITAEHNNNQNIEKNKVTEAESRNDVTSPTLILTDSKIIITAGIQINYKAFIETAHDDQDGNLVDAVTYNVIDTSISGNYIIDYTVSDQAGNTTTASLQVTVVDDYKLAF